MKGLDTYQPLVMKQWIDLMHKFKRHYEDRAEMGKGTKWWIRMGDWLYEQEEGWKMGDRYLAGGYGDKNPEDVGAKQQGKELDNSEKVGRNPRRIPNLDDLERIKRAKLEARQGLRYVTNQQLGVYSVTRYCSNCYANTESVHKYGTPAPDLWHCVNCGLDGALKVSGRP
jgi:hypothetical protein